MLHAALAGFILSLIYKLLDKKYVKNDGFHAEIDWWMGFAVVIACTAAISVTYIAIKAFALPEFLAIVGFSFYILIPFYIFKLLLDYKGKKAIIYSIWVPFISILAEIPFALMQGVPNT